ncbi:MarR family transcriptional regulator [Actinomadura barringtoniae]|uniref:MarR family transcriptional regulator n=1 Tax=Actinomadura barringtoniae TaxID=1427535 RepID=A0A939PI30_9ACTN|nr:MarR family transcriptional regulator [Actinomadura barringtoniae]MBO2452672.1 MarR family transcriptional regulator [Actinomadura barringtoniae]
MHDERLANLLGALSLTVRDLMLGDVLRATGTSASGAAAIKVAATEPGLSVTELGRRIGLSQPAAARMIDALEARGLAERRPAASRSVAVHLTDQGRQAAEQIRLARIQALLPLSDSLDENERAVLAGLFDKLLDAAYDRLPDSELLCRLCDGPACLSGGNTCPVSDARNAREAGDTREATDER